MFPQPHDDSYKVLAVDDSPDNLFLIETILDDPAYELTCVENSQEALEKVIQIVPDLVLLDVMMPGMNGYEVTRAIRQDTTLPYIPILLITAHDQSSLVEGLDAGADDFIRKPVDVNELLARVRSLLRLKQTMDHLEQMVQQRDDFVARLTHDLRTPLVAANRMLTFCRNDDFGPVADGAKQAIASIIQNNKHLLHMVNTLLEVHRHEANQKALTYTDFNLHDLASDILAELQPLASEKQLSCQFCNCQDVLQIERTDFQIKGDQIELRRVVTNLLDNAIKFTDQGHVHIRMKKQTPADVPQKLNVPPGALPYWLTLTVEDSGPGIPLDEQVQIFQRFRQGTQFRAGSGLGLHLARRIAKLHGGTITVDSQPGNGSRFTLWLPPEPYLP